MKAIQLKLFMLRNGVEKKKTQHSSIQMALLQSILWL